MQFKLVNKRTQEAVDTTEQHRLLESRMEEYFLCEKANTRQR